MIRELLIAKTNPDRIPKPKAGFFKLIGDGETVYALFPDGSYVDLGSSSASTSGVSGTYTVGQGAISNGTITVVNGVITAVTEAA